MINTIYTRIPPSISPTCRLPKEYCGVTSHVARGSSALRIKFSLALLLLLILPVLALPQNDPLSLGYLPPIDTNTADYPRNIWITDTMQKVRQDSGAPGSAHWGTFYGTQNEYVDFQVHVQAPLTGISSLTVSTSDFVQSAPSSFTISAASTNVIVYREAYMNVTIASNNQADSAVPGGANFNTYYGGALGYYPDILIPTKDPYWHQATNAWPFTVAAGKNQSAWIDVLIPSNAPSGYYLGSVTVKSGSTVLATMPVILGVWQWPGTGFMPATPTLKIESAGLQYSGMCTQMYVGDGSTGSQAGCAAYPDSGGNADGGVTRILLDADLLMKDHRYGGGGKANVFPESGSFATFNTLVGPVMNGTCVHGGAVCAVLPSSKLTTKQIATLSGPTSAVFSNWQTNFNSNGWSTGGVSNLYDYLCDEPPAGCGSWANLNANATTRHGFAAPLVAELVTTDYPHASANGALNSIDIMVSAINALEPMGGPLQNLSNYTSWRAGPNPAGIPRQWWSYQACPSAGTCGNGSPGPGPSGSRYTTWPNYNIDGKPAANRAMEWLTYLHGQTGELYYATDICMAPASQGALCGYPTHPQDPWISVYYSGGWGDGTLLYAGGVAPGKSNYMGAGVTTPIILPSLRLKQIRDGIQDYEYLNVLKNNGKSAEATAQLNSWVTNSYTFEASGTGLQAARQVLGTTMHQLTYPVLLLPPTGLKGIVQ